MLHDLDYAHVQACVADGPHYAWSFVRVEYKAGDRTARTCIRHYLGQRDKKNAEARPFRQPVIESGKYDYVWSLLAKSNGIHAT
ncbi:MAG: hypothetical protein B7Y47_12470 [Sphingomonas sp. 28-63-12]|nr:MAG: hypothetical protein B7Y47_12470 [Sphingomonas sp. 28-63-12]